MLTRRSTFRGLLGAAAILIGTAGTANAGLIIEIDFDLSTAAPDVVSTGDANGNAFALYQDAAGNFVTVTAFSGSPDDGLLTDVNFQSNIQDGVDATIRIFDDNFLLGDITVPVTSTTTPTTVGPATTTIVTSIDGQVILNTGPLVSGPVTHNSTILANLMEPTIIEHLISIKNDSGQVSLTTFDTTTEVPEPSMTALLGLGLIGFAVARRRRLNG